MPLDRAAVKAYADKHWFTVCDDGYFLSRRLGQAKVSTIFSQLAAKHKLSDPKSWRVAFLPEVADGQSDGPFVRGGAPVIGKERACFIRKNPQGDPIPAKSAPPELLGRWDILPFHSDSGLVDCAHYVSRCLTTGGVSINDGSVPSLVAKLQNGAAYTKMTKTLGQFVTLEVGQRIVESGVMAYGDLVAYAHGTSYSHSALYVGASGDGVHRITCHTLSRMGAMFNGSTWNLTIEPSWRFTLIHFDTGEDAIPQQIADLFKPTLAIDSSGKTIYCTFLDNGRVERRTKPSGAVDANGYWFVRGGKVFVFWPRQGEVMEISLSASDGIPSQALVNGAASDVRVLPS